MMTTDPLRVSMETTSRQVPSIRQIHPERHVMLTRQQRQRQRRIAASQRMEEVREDYVEQSTLEETLVRSRREYQTTVREDGDDNIPAQRTRTLMRIPRIMPIRRIPPIESRTGRQRLHSELDDAVTIRLPIPRTTAEENWNPGVNSVPHVTVHRNTFFSSDSILYGIESAFEEIASDHPKPARKLPEEKCFTCKEEDCSICHDTIPEFAEIYKLTCEHMFHQECLNPWMQKSNSCPNCRAVIVKE